MRAVFVIAAAENCGLIVQHSGMNTAEIIRLTIDLLTRVIEFHKDDILLRVLQMATFLQNIKFSVFTPAGIQRGQGHKANDFAKCIA